MTEYEQIRYEVDGPTLLITMNRPDHLNAFTGVMREEMIDAYHRADADDSIRVDHRHRRRPRVLRRRRSRPRALDLRSHPRR